MGKNYRVIGSLIGAYLKGSDMPLCFKETRSDIFYKNCKRMGDKIGKNRKYWR